MARYEVLVDYCELAAKGATFESDDFAHRNINYDALVESGVVRLVATPTSKPKPARDAGTEPEGN